MADGPTSFNVGQGGDPYDQLLTQVRDAATGVYDVLGEMGRSRSGNVVYLARELESGHLVAMKLSRVSESASGEFNLEVVKTLDSSVPGLENKCPECKAVLPDWDRFCFRCGADLSGSGSTPGVDESAQLLEAVKEATAGEYDILGKMDRADGKGAVFFARDLKRNKLVALRLKKDQSADPNQAAYSIGETQVFRPMAAELGATQVASAYSAPPPVLPKVETRETPVQESVAPPPATPPPPPPRAPGPRKFPVRAVAGGVGVVLIGLIGYFAFRAPPGPVAPPPAVVDPPPAPPPPAADSIAPPPALPPPPPALPPPVATSAVDSATIVVSTQLPASAEVTVDGRRIRGTRIRVGAGTHSIALAATGFEPVSSRLTVKAGEVTRWRPKLVAAKVVVQNPPPPPPVVTPTCARAFAKPDWVQAADLCAKEAAAGDVLAQRNYGQILEEGRGVKADPAQAAVWYGRAAASGNHDAQLRLGYLYRSGTGVKRDEKQAATFFKLAAVGGVPSGMLEYAVALEEGKGIDRNEALAADWYRKASAGGNDRATWLLGRLYERGKGVEKNEAEAANLYRQAGQRGFAEAAYSLGKMYKDGKGVEKSTDQAIEWFRKAAQAGHRQAAEELEDLEKH